MLSSVTSHEQLDGVALQAHLPHLGDGLFAKVGRVYIHTPRQQDAIQFSQQPRQLIVGLGRKYYNAGTLTLQSPQIGLEQAPYFGAKESFCVTRLRGYTDEHVPILHRPTPRV